MAGVEIPVKANFDKADASAALAQFVQEFNKVGVAVAQANKLEFKPVSKATLEDMKRLQAQFDALRKVHGDLNKRLKDTGQGAAGFLQVDWNKLYPDAHSRNRQMLKAFEYVSGTTFGAGAQPPGGGGGGKGGGGGANQPPGAPNQPGRGGGGGNGGGGVLGAGLNAMGPVGGVINNSIGAGMSGGLRAGLLGLGGGLAALALGKMVGAAREKIGSAENEMVQLDTLKRQLGDVGVSFNVLKEAVRGASSQIGVTFDEGQRLAQQYARTAGASGDPRAMGEEVATAGQFGRGLGLDPSQSTGFFAQMRLQQATNNDMQARRMALLIGEGIARSGAFAKADVVLEAIASYVTTQTRSSMSRANVEGYNAMLSGMMASKIPGMDAASAAALLGRMNSAVAGGGAHGEASQNFQYTALRGGTNDPLDVAIRQEGGMFGTGRSAFGPGSAYADYAARNGLGIPAAANDDRTNFELLQAQLRQMYGNSSEGRKLMANAMANHYGITNSQAMAVSGINPMQLGGMGRRLERLGINLKDVNASGIAAMGGIEADGSLSESEKDKRMFKAARDGQEMTDGKAIRDSKVALDNIFQAVATKLIPLTQGVRDGVMFLAGGGKMSGRQIQERMLGIESDERKSGIQSEFENRLRAAGQERAEARKAVQELVEKNKGKVASGEMTQEQHAQQMKPLLEREQEALRKDTAAREWRREQLEAKAARLEQNVRTLREEDDARRKAMEETDRALKEGRPLLNSQAGGGRGFVNPPTIGALNGKEGQAERDIQHFMAKGWTREQASGIVSNIIAESGQRHDAVGDGGKAYGLAQWHPNRQADFREWAGKDIRDGTYQEQLDFIHHEMTSGKERSAGDRLRRATSAGEAGDIVSRYYERPKNADGDASKRAGMADRLYSMPLPDQAGAKPQGVAVSGQAEITVRVEDRAGRTIAPTQNVPVALVSKPNPAGT